MLDLASLPYFYLLLCVCVCVCVVLGFELRALYHLSYSTSPSILFSL
jgi:hypothetical protein